MSDEQNTNEARGSLVQKAFAELEGLNSFLGGSTSPHTIKLAEKAHALIDAYLDRTDGEKEELKAFAVLKMGAPFMFDDTTRFKTEYSQNVSDMVDALLEGQKTENLAQVDMALTAALIEVTRDYLKTPEGIQEFLQSKPSAADMEAAYERFTAMRQGLEYASAPRLRAYEQKMYETYMKEIGSLLISHRPAPPSPAPDNGFQPG